MRRLQSRALVSSGERPAARLGLQLQSLSRIPTVAVSKYVFAVPQADLSVTGRMILADLRAKDLII